MRREHILFRLTAVAAVASLAVPFPLYAQAQPAPPQSAPPQSSQTVNPPARVGALTRIQGNVSFHAQGADSWSPATLNYPVTTGEGFWTEQGAEARIDISDTDLVLAGNTELEISDLETMAMVASLPQGEAFLQIRDLQPGETYTLVTPRGSATFASPGRYGVLAGDSGTPTVITVLDGSATLGDGAQGTLTAGQAAQITGEAAPFQVQVAAAQPDAFINHVLSEQRPPPAPRASAAPALVSQMPGGAELAEYGTWSSTPQYGQVWYPQVSSDWVPYREGHWAYVQPWGWTWVDSDPWGFAPFHYGRWAQIDGRWGWLPGYAQPVAAAPAYPVYAPALVTFFGVGLAAGVTAALLNRGSVGWVPLGPNEPYRPWFHAPPQYVRDVNIRHVNNITQITSITNNRNVTVNNVTINKFRNAPGATVVPATAMATSRPIGAVARRPDPQMLAQAHPVVGRAPIPPTRATAGVTPAVARSVHVLPAPAGTPLPRSAPGPAIRPAAARPGAPGRVERPPLRHAAAVGAARPPEHAAGPAAPAPGAHPEAAHPSAAVPALRAPGARPPEHPLTGQGAAPAPEAAHRPGTPPGHPEAARPEAARPELAHPGAAPVPHVAAPGRPEAPRVEHPAVPVAHAPRAPERPETHPAPAAAPRPEPPHAAASEARPAPHPTPAARPEIHAAAPAPRPEVQAAPRPAPRPEVHAAAPAPRPEFHAPPPAPRPEVHAAAPAPHPPPPPHPEARPAPAPHPAPHQEKRPGEK